MKPPGAAPRLPGHPALAPVRASLGNLFDGDWPGPDAWTALARQHGVINARGLPLAFVAPSSPPTSALDFERRILDAGEVETRDANWHDTFHACAWLMFPLTKARINALHVEEGQDTSPNRRSALRNTLTLFDEGGMVVASADASLLDLLRGFRWKALFHERREEVRRAMDFVIFGHALYERALAMHYGSTGNGILVNVEPGYFELDGAARVAHLDLRLAALLDAGDFPASSRDLQPVPIKGIPGWAIENEDSAYYDDIRQFRPGRRATC